MDIGNQYKRDDKTDKSGFLRKARFHQSRFRAVQLKRPFDSYGNYLTQEDAKNGFNFFEGFEIFEAVQKFSNYKKALYANLLRSEHIPFNLFIPLDKDKEYAKMVFIDILGHEISSIDRIEIEYAPKPKKEYLNDATAFDAYIEYTFPNESKGIIGIEVKYTEREYPLKANSKEEKEVNDLTSPYFQITEKCGLFKPNSTSKLISDKFRQVWRNHILGESILLRDSTNFSKFTSITVFPKGNKHFVETSTDYQNLLIKNDNNFIGLTFEKLFEIFKNHSPNENYAGWIKYLNSRYIVTEQ
jgi:hypothetical protein